MADALRTILFCNSGPMTSQAGGFNNVSLNASGAGVGWAFQANSADPITHLGFRYGTRTGTPPTYIISLQSLTGSGQPDGTILGAGTPASVTFTPPADTTWNSLWKWQQLDNAYTPTRGQVLASCIEYSSGTVDGSNFSSFTRDNSSFAQANHFPTSRLKTAGTWAMSGSPSIFGYRTASGRYGNIAQSNAPTSIASVSTAGHRYGMFFTLPSGHGTTFRVLGVRLAGQLANASSSFKLGLWQTNGTELQAVTIDSDFANSVASNARLHDILFDEISLSDLSFGTKYYIGLEVVSGTSSVNCWQLAEAADRSCFPNGTNRGLVSYNGSVWTEDDTAMPVMELIIDDITVPSGGGGLLGSSVMTGGFHRT